MEKVTEILSKHGWPPATLLTLVVALAGIYFLYHDNQDMINKYQNLTEQNLEVNIRLLEQGKRQNELFSSFVKMQTEHSDLLRRIELERREQRIEDRQITSFAVQALQQISDKVDITLQQKTPKELLEKR